MSGTPDRKSQRFQVHVTKGAGPRGSKVWSVIVIAFLLVAGGAFYYLWAMDDRLVEHLRKRDAVAVAAAWSFYYKDAAPPEAYQPLLDASTEGTPALRRASVLALSAYHNRDPVPHLCELMVKDPSAEIRAAAARALGENGDNENPNIDEALEKAFPDGDAKVREEAARAAGIMRFESNIPSLISLLGDANQRVKEAAQHALEAFTPGEESYGMNRMAWQEWYEGKR